MDGPSDINPRQYTMMKRILNKVASKVSEMTREEDRTAKYDKCLRSLAKMIVEDDKATATKLDRKKERHARNEKKINAIENIQEKLSKAIGVFDDSDDHEPLSEPLSEEEKALLKYEKRVIKSVREVAAAKLNDLKGAQKPLRDENALLKGEVDRLADRLDQDREQTLPTLAAVNHASQIASMASSAASSKFGSSRVSSGGSGGSGGSSRGSQGSSRGSRRSPPAWDSALNTNTPITATRANSSSTFLTAMSRSDSVDHFSQPEPSPRVSPKVRASRQRLDDVRPECILPMPIPSRERPVVVDSMNTWIQ